MITQTPQFLINGPELWEIVFGVLKGDVPDELTDEVFQKIADHINEAFLIAETNRCAAIVEYSSAVSVHSDAREILADEIRGVAASPTGETE